MAYIISSGETSTGVVFNVYDSMTILEGGTANRTTVNSYGYLHVSFGGTANSTTVNSYGYLYVSFGGVVNQTTVNRGFASVYSGGTANSSILNTGYLTVYSGGTANNTLAQALGEIYVIDGGIANSTTVRNSGTLNARSGGTANMTTVSDWGRCFVSSGGTVTNTIVDPYGIHIVRSSGTAINTTVNSCGRYVISNCGTAISATVFNGGSMFVLAGGTAKDIFENGGYVDIETGANVTFASNTFSGEVPSNTSATIHSGTTANSVIVCSGGDLLVYSGGTAINTTVNSKGSIYIFSGGVASNVRIYSGGNVTIENAILTGKITFSEGGTIHVKQGTIFDFDISHLAPGTGVLLNDWALIQDSLPAFTLTISDLQWNGMYALVKGITELNNKISVKSQSNGSIQMVAAGETINVDGVEYTLSLTDDMLFVTVSGSMDIPIIPVSADITEFTNHDVTLSASFSEDAISREYSFDNETWHVYTEPVKCSVNGTVYFLGKDQHGFTNEIASYEVTNIDTEPPSIPGEQASEVNGYTANLSWSAASDTSGGAVTYEYRIATDNKYSQIVKSGTTETCTTTIEELKFGKYYWSVRSVDMAGNLSSWSLNKDFTIIDEVAPTIPANLVCSIENQSTLSVNWNEASDDFLGCGVNRYEIQLSIDEAFGSIVESFSTTDTEVIIGPLSKGDYYLRICAVDNAGNRSDWTAAESFTIETDTIPPTINDIKADITEPTNENVTVTAMFADNYALESSQYKIGKDGEWTDYKNGVIVTENAVVYFRAVDTTGNETEASYEVKNIDRTKPVITLNSNTQTPVQQTTLTAIVDDGSAILYRINNSGEWTAYTRTIAVLANASYSFKATDAAGNTGTAEITFKNIDTIPPVLTLTADTVTLSNSVTLIAETNEETVISYSSDYKNWTTYESPLEVKANGRYYFKAVDVAGNVDNAEIEFTNIDAVSPTAPTGLRSFVDGQDVALLWNVSTDDFSGVKEYLVTYSLDGQDFTARTVNSNYVLNNADFGTYSWSVQAVDFAGNESALIAGDAFTVSGFKPYTVEYSADNFEHVIRFTVSTPTLDSFRMPTGTYQLRIRQEGSSEWMTGDSIVAAEFDSTPQLIKSDADGNADVFFANPVGTWESCYVAQHVGSINDWAGTNEFASVFGKNKLADIIEGSTDANILLMTDDENGDTLFVDDIYTASPGNMAEQQARIAQIDEIRAGAGNDIVDMTSQQFEYIGDGLTIRGGEGNDTIWANKGDNWLFGDAGNDRIVGASGEDVIVGGIGNDRMHGGGGNDVFTFCDNWGVDNVEQLATGSVTLWFAEGSKDNWDEATLTYSDGDNSVKVSGVTADKVTLKFGDDGSAQFASLTSMGAFFDATTERIFEESGKGILASL